MSATEADGAGNSAAPLWETAGGGCGRNGSLVVDPVRVQSVILGTFKCNLRLIQVELYRVFHQRVDLG